MRSVAFVTISSCGYGSLRAQGRRQNYRGLDQQIAEIAPFEVFALDQLDLPVTLPSLQLLLPGDRFIRAFISLDIHKAVHAIGLHKRGALAAAMLLQSIPHVICHPDIQGPVASAREDVDVIHTRYARN